VIVCDNASGDESVRMIRMLAQRLLTAWVPPGHPARGCSVPSQDEPVAFGEYAEGQWCAGGDPDAQLVLLHTGANLAFARWCKAGIRNAIARGDSDAIWLLNNDTVLDKGALGALLAAMRGHDRGLLASSHILYMSEPDRAWFEGGIVEPLKTSGRHVPSPPFSRSARSYLTGCAPLTTRQVWERIGLLDESFFMYGTRGLLPARH
jgi:GT2 family glycosyltransferase